LSLPPIIRALKLEEDSEAEREEREARLKANEAALARLNELGNGADKGALGRLRAEYEEFHKLSNDPRVTRIGRILRKSGNKDATLYEVITRDTAEEFTSSRRRKHNAYDGD